MQFLQAPQQSAGLSEGIRLTEERLPNSRMRVSVEVPATSVRWYYERVLQSSRKSLDIPGFRKGKKVRLLCSKQGCCYMLCFPCVCFNALRRAFTALWSEQESRTQLHVPSL